MNPGKTRDPGKGNGVRVLHVYKTSRPQTVGGVATFLDTLCRSTAERGVRNTVFSLSRASSGAVELPGYRVVQAREDLHFASTGFSRAAFSLFPKLVRDADIVHYHFPYPFADLLHFACRVKKPALVTYQSDIVRQRLLRLLYEPLMHRFFRSVDHVVATSPNYAATSDTLQRYRNKTTVIPIALESAHYPPLDAERVAYWRSRLPARFFLFVGALRYYKGLHLLIEALKGTGMTAVIAGEGEMGEWLKAQARNLEPQRVRFLGQISDEDKVALLHLCYAYVFPSHLRSEAFGISLLEAAMYGKALISSEIGTGTSFINLDGETGRVVAPSCVRELREAMAFMLDNPETVERMGRHAQARHRMHFAAAAQAQAYTALYGELLGRSAGRVRSS